MQKSIFKLFRVHIHNDRLILETNFLLIIFQIQISENMLIVGENTKYQPTHKHVCRLQIPPSTSFPWQWLWEFQWVLHFECPV